MLRLATMSDRDPMEQLEGPCGLSSTSALARGGLRVPLLGGLGVPQRSKAKARAPKKQAAVLKRILGQAVAFNRAQERQYMWRRKAKEEGEDPKKTWKLFRLWGQGLKKLDRTKVPSGKDPELNNERSADIENKEVAQAVLQRLQAYRERLVLKQVEGNQQNSNAMDVVALADDDDFEAGRFSQRPPPSTSLAAAAASSSSSSIVLKGKDLAKVAKKMKHELKEQAKQAKEAMRLEKRRQRAERKVKKKEKKAKKKEKRARKIQQLLEHEVEVTADIRAKIEALSISRAANLEKKNKVSKREASASNQPSRVHRPSPKQEVLLVKDSLPSQGVSKDLQSAACKPSSVSARQKARRSTGTLTGHSNTAVGDGSLDVMAVNETICLSSSEED